MSRRQSPTLFILDDLIRRGQLAAARRALVALARRRLQRPERAQAAFLAWRAGLARLGLSLLHRIVRPPARLKAPATDEEKSVFAACLIQLGALEEGTALLQTVDPRVFPEALFTHASAAVAQWEYGEAARWLGQYLASPGIEPYRRLVAQLNLAAAQVFESHVNEAGALLAELEPAARKGCHVRLYAHIMELKTLCALQSKRWQEAASLLQQAEKSLGREGGWDSFLLQKWRTLARLCELGANPETLGELNTLRGAARERGYWEVARDCDHYESAFAGNANALFRAYFGTPHAHFRAKLLADFKFPVELPPSYLWFPPGAPGRCRREIDLAAGMLDNSPFLRPGETSQRLLLALSRDFYRPARTANLFSALHPRDPYHPVYSPARVRQAIYRLRLRFRAERLPLRIEETEGDYRLIAAEGLGLRVTVAPAPESRPEGELLRLQARCGNRPFSGREARQILGRPERTVRRLLERGVQDGLLTREGQSTAIRYRFRSSSGRQAA